LVTPAEFDTFGLVENRGVVSVGGSGCARKRGSVAGSNRGRYASTTTASVPLEFHVRVLV